VIGEGCGTHVEEKKFTQGFGWGNQKESNPLADLGTGWEDNIELNVPRNTMGVGGAGTVFIWLRTGLSGGLLSTQ
jgi:hypothetical protein